MAVYKRIKKIDGYTMMSNYHLRDMNLSLKASGLLSLVLFFCLPGTFTIPGSFVHSASSDTFTTGVIHFSTWSLCFRKMYDTFYSITW